MYVPQLVTVFGKAWRVWLVEEGLPPCPLSVILVLTLKLSATGLWVIMQALSHRYSVISACLSALHQDGHPLKP